MAHKTKAEGFRRSKLRVSVVGEVSRKELNLCSALRGQVEVTRGSEDANPHQADGLCKK